MPQKRKPVRKPKPKKVSAQTRKPRNGSLTVGNVSASTGVAIGYGARVDVIHVQGTGGDEIGRAFQLLRQKVGQSPRNSGAVIAEQALKELETEARRGDQASADSIQKWLNFLASTAPDVWDVAIDTFTNPIKGIGTIFRKIAERAKAERNEKKV